MRYRLTAPHYLVDTYYDTNAEVEWRGPPSSNMEPLDDEARAAVKKFKPRGFDINQLVPPAAPRSAEKPQDEAAQVYASDPVKQQAMRDRMAKVSEAKAAKAGATEG